MFEELNRDILTAKENQTKKRKFDDMVKQTRQVLQNELAKKSKLKDILQDETEDVSKLESLSITGLFYSILGSKEKQLEKERQELLSAKLKYDECCNSISVIERDLASYEESYKRYIGADSEYEIAMKRKEELILKSNDENTNKLIELMDKNAELEVMKKEVNEALKAGEIVKDEISNVMKSLESAENWGTWDMMGGGFLATSAKHSRIDEAREYAHNAKIALRRFQNELSDIDLTADFEINIGSFEKFADYFFDGLISDWVVQSRIRESSESVSYVGNDVNKVMRVLKEKLTTVDNDLISISKNIKQLIELA